MSRGYIFNVEPHPDRLGIGETVFYDSLDALKADFVQNVGMEEAVRLVKDFTDNLSKAGFAVRPFRYKDGAGSVRNGYILETHGATKLQEAQMSYFSSRMEQLKLAVEELDQVGFCSSSSYAYALRDLIHDPHGDVVFSINGGCKDMDDFIRDLQEGKTLYIGADVVLMH